MSSVAFLPSWTASLVFTALALGAAWAWWRYGGWKKGRGAANLRSSVVILQRQQSQALTQHASVHAVRWNGEELLVACTPQQVTLLARSRPDTGAEA